MEYFMPVIDHLWRLLDFKTKLPNLIVDVLFMLHH